jgi:Ribosomal protein L7/L12 C-terminal domain
MKPEVIVTDAELPAEVLRAIEKGRKIEAIKILRERTGIGLANAKVLVERSARQLAEQNPRPELAESGSGMPRLLMSLLLAVLIFAVYRHLTVG